MPYTTHHFYTGTYNQSHYGSAGGGCSAVLALCHKIVLCHHFRLQTGKYVEVDA